jgi:hypothetical protein
MSRALTCPDPFASLAYLFFTSSSLFVLMRKVILCLAVLICSKMKLLAQINFSANDVVPAYNGYFYYGINGGYAMSWDAPSIADICAGNPVKGVPGLSSRTFRTLFSREQFVTYGGNYNLYISQYNYYFGLGMKDFTAMIFLPSPAERDNTFYDRDGKPAAGNWCNTPSNLFKNMYAPIWDGGVNGTPVNDTNYYAKFVYEVVTRYKPYVKFWEIVNEPDFDNTGTGWKGRGEPGNWWENLPDPCALNNVRAPIFHYIRMLRIAYEVIKSVDPTAFVGPGGLGYASFADNLCRYTDNPNGGAVTAEYSKPGSAYFDVLSYHSYPAFNMGAYSNAVGGWVYYRHSDRASDEFVRVKNEFDSVLHLYGYNGVKYPKKVFICTEANVPSKAFNQYIGSDAAQTNFVMKAFVQSQKHKVLQTYIYASGDAVPVWQATDGFECMGMYENLVGKGPVDGGTGYNQVMKPSGYGFRTIASQLLYSRYDSLRTVAMNLPANINGAAFRDTVGNYTYVLWARTTIDHSEAASATYAFPAAMNVSPETKARYWDFSKTGKTEIIHSDAVQLTGAPMLLSDNFAILPIDDKPKPQPEAEKEFTSVTIYPNPAKERSSIAFTLKGNTHVSLDIYTTDGKLVAKPVTDRAYKAGTYSILLPVEQLVSGVYYCHFKTERSEEIKKLVVTK